MRRPVLVTLVVLGSLVCLVGGTGLFAALTDSARTGTNSVESADLAASADIQIATATPGAPVTCGTWQENLTTAFITVSDLEADGLVKSQSYFCLRNVGSQTVSVVGLANELTEVDTGCSGDEVIYDPTSCGGNAAGELAQNLMVAYVTLNCATGGGSGGNINLQTNATTGQSVGPDLAPGAIGCYSTWIWYPNTTAATAIQAAQSDTVTWRYEFFADAS